MGDHQLIGPNIILFVHQEISHEPCWQEFLENQNVGVCFQNWQIGQNLEKKRTKVVAPWQPVASNNPKFAWPKARNTAWKQNLACKPCCGDASWF